jgi:hypothetical protein
MEWKASDTTAKKPFDSRTHDLCLGVIVEQDGRSWCCDGDVDPTGDLADQGCWSIDDDAFHAYR